jgi:glycosyltransferase involved in cell wall biosynthesis
MKKIRKVAIVDPYLDVMGGGEKHILSIAQIFDESDFQVDLLWNDKNVLPEIQEKLGLSFGNLHIIENFLNDNNILDKLSRTNDYDFLLYVTDGSYFMSCAQNNYVFAMYPKKELYEKSLLNDLKLSNYKFIANSKYTADFLEKYTDRKFEVIYPYITNEKIKMENGKKDRVILSVGRFFQGLHSKRHDVLIQAFNRLQREDKNFKNYKLYLIGGLKDEDRDYFNELKNLAEDNENIIFKENVSNSELLNYYQKAEYYWHAAGYEVDIEKNPEYVEHFGITPLEAMKYQCLVFCYNEGGPKEIIENGKTGYLWNSIDELCDMTSNSEKNREEIIKNAIEMINEKFSYEIFKEKVKSYFGI